MRKRFSADKYLAFALALAAFAAAGMAPAFAQPADHFGSQLPHYFDSNGAEIFGSWGPRAAASSGHVLTPRSGLSAFARVPGGASGSFGSQLFGGGSIGYNENLRIDQW
jgi:hypothetical protein